MRADSKIARIGTLALWLAAVSGPAAAQSQVPAVQEQQRPAQGLRETERAERAFKAAEELRPLEAGERVTYADVLQHPDDVELNYLYAQSQVESGDLRGAAATLERILLLAPDLARVRLLYAVVLFRLDNLNEAEREFRTVSELPMPDSLREEVDSLPRADRAAAQGDALLRHRRRRHAVGQQPQRRSRRRPGALSRHTLRSRQGKKESDFSGVMLAAPARAARPRLTTRATR